MLSAGCAMGAGPVLAAAPARSVMPVLRRAPGGWRDIAAIIEDEALPGKVSVAAADMTTRAPVATYAPLRRLPPASVAKIVTAAYALETLGPDHRFATRILARGNVVGGTLHGDLALVGGGDPTLDSDALGDLAAALGASGITAVAGRFLVDARALPAVDRIDRSQPDHLAYNPAVAGLNLNFNRVFLEWQRAGHEVELTLDARARRFRPQVHGLRVRASSRNEPIFAYEQGDGFEAWSVADGALGRKGGRWLPVRRPVRYAAEVFRTLASHEGIALPEPIEAPADGTWHEVCRHDSRALLEIVRGMLKFSTNLTAEVIGLAATQARGHQPRDLASSAHVMATWAKTAMGARRLSLVDHSGLGPDSRVNAQDLLSALLSPVGRKWLPGTLKDMHIALAHGDSRTRVLAKTGTLNFVSNLAGYVTQGDGREGTAFVILSADLPRRARIPRAQRERPPGQRRWLSRAHGLQRELVDCLAQRRAQAQSVR